MTLCIAVEYEGGILLGCDSRTVYGRGVPISRDTNKIHIIKKEGVAKEEIAVMGAGIVAFVDKFIRMFKSEDLTKIAESIGKSSLILSDVINKVAEPLAAAIYNEYVEERKIVREEPFDLIIAGFEEDKADVFTLYGLGIAEPIHDFGAIGSGAAYAELFLRHLLPSKREIDNVIEPVCYTIRLVGTIDPYVGGKINLATISEEGIKDLSDKAVELQERMATNALKAAMEELKKVLNKKR